MAKSSHPLMQLLMLLLFVLLMFIGLALVEAVLTMAGVDITSLTAIYWIQALTQVAVFAVPVWIVVRRYYRGSERQWLRLDGSRQSWLAALTGVVAMLLMVPLCDLLTAWNDGWQLGTAGEALRRLQEQSEALIEQILSHDTVGGLAANLVVVALVPAVCEELLFRAGIQNLLQRWLKSPHATVWLTAVVFSLAHGEVFALMPRLVLGAMLGYLYIYGGSLVADTAAHFANNAVVVVVYWLHARGIITADLSEPFTWGWLTTVCCTLAAVGLLWSTLGRRKAAVPPVPAADSAPEASLHD